ncbi:MAG: glycosyltransferase involved in cell wall biosynthesis [Francisellaceae bacterium]|jgi:glycosyltransferase involved in cell wall biosynthesis
MNNKASNTSILLTIILPFLDAEYDIHGVFKSIKDQVKIDKSRIEILLVNDGSTDNTVPLSEKYSTKMLYDYNSFKVFSHGKRAGLSKTRIDGAKIARGKNITFIDKRTRPDPYYIHNLLNKEHHVVIGSPYINKNAGIWPRVLSLAREKLYYPYFNHDFDDIILNQYEYRKFKNKGGGGAMLVPRKSFIQIAQSLGTSQHSNDDSKLIEKLAEIDPILKTSSARIEYLNRTGYWENIMHLYNRGPKFVDYYLSRDSRFFPHLISLIVLVPIVIFLLFIPNIIWWLIIVMVGSVGVYSVYISNTLSDFMACIVIVPITLFVFSLGIFRGLFLKLINKY